MTSTDFVQRELMRCIFFQLFSATYVNDILLHWTLCTYTCQWKSRLYYLLNSVIQRSWLHWRLLLQRSWSPVWLSVILVVSIWDSTVLPRWTTTTRHQDDTSLLHKIHRGVLLKRDSAFISCDHKVTTPSSWSSRHVLTISRHDTSSSTILTVKVICSVNI